MLTCGGDNTSESLLQLLPENEELYGMFDELEARAHRGSFPYLPHSTSFEGMKDFLNAARTNATSRPQVLGLIFATLAVCERFVRREKRVSREGPTKNDAYGKS